MIEGHKKTPFEPQDTTLQENFNVRRNQGNPAPGGMAYLEHGVRIYSTTNDHAQRFMIRDSAAGLGPMTL